MNLKKLASMNSSKYFPSFSKFFIILVVSDDINKFNCLFLSLKLNEI